MDISTAIPLALAVGGPLAAGLWWGAQQVYAAFNRLTDHERRLGAIDEDLSDMRHTQEQHDERIERTEEGVRNISKLADAINSMGERVNGQIGHLAEVMGIHNKNNEERFEDLKDQIREQRTFRPSDK